MAQGSLTHPADLCRYARDSRHLVAGLLACAVGVAGALGLHELVEGVGVLTWSVLLGALVANVNALPSRVQPGLRTVVGKLLRVGVVLLGFSLSLVSIADLGLPVIGLVVTTLLATLLVTTWAGLRIGLGRPRSLLIGTGFAICGASAIAAMKESAEADEDDVATAITMVTICGTVAMVAVPLLQAPFALTDQQLGVWAGASVHEVGQVVAAAGPAGATAVAVAAVVKLTRVLLLAPVVAGVGLLRHRSASAADHEADSRRPPIVPLFVLGFLVCVCLRSLNVVPVEVLDAIEHVQTVALGAALFGLGTAVRLRSLVHAGGLALALGAVSTLVVAGLSLAGVLWVV
ncbi:MAG TPA: putative sulfate exporter family transporter [Nocardioidaceae bacterium]|nr:putative sulfate exporter family transporter [Nocardioidaceae bacterium]